MKYEERNPDDHRCGEWKCRTCDTFQRGDHFCYHRAINNTSVVNNKKFIFYDFETRQDERMECDQGYSPSDRRCEKCSKEDQTCQKCRTCTNCGQYNCGLYKHLVNFAVLQSACQKCMKEDLTPQSRCDICGRRCPTCWKTGKNNRFKAPPCTDTCGFRESVFCGDEASQLFCEYILQPQCKDSILIAHNAEFRPVSHFGSVDRQTCLATH